MKIPSGEEASIDQIRGWEREEAIRKQLAAAMLRVDTLTRENFALAASQCPGGYGDEGGTPRCCAEKEIARLTRENEGLNSLLRDAYRGLHDLLQDTQHSEHFCGDPNCPVKFAEGVDERLRAALAGASGAQEGERT